MEVIDFSLPDQDGKIHTLSEYKGKWIILYFYPKDDTPGCTTEACNFRDSFHKLEQMGAVILGISKDSVGSHKKFVEKYNLNFPILSDESLTIIKKYNASPKLGNGILRKTYLINPQFEIEKIYENVNPTLHSEELINYLQSKK